MTSTATWARARSVLVGVLNLRSLAALFYFCLFLVLAAKLPQFVHASWSDWIGGVAFTLRQTLVSAVTMLGALSALAVIDALWQPQRFARLLVMVFVVGVGAALGMAVRLAIGTLALGDLGQHLGRLAGQAMLWWLIGSVLALLLAMDRDAVDEQAEALSVQHEQRRLEAEQAEARLAVLQAQIEPHFLFNTLANVKRLHDVDEARGRAMLTSLIAYLEAALPSMRAERSTLGRELDMVGNYLAIIAARMGDRLRYRIQRADDVPRDLAVPSLVLATLVENAIKHGLSGLPEGGMVSVEVHRFGDGVELCVRDDGLGFSGAAGSGVGLANIRARLASRYGARASLRLEANAPRGVVARVLLPAEAA